MVTITYFRERSRVEIIGHASFAENGKDLVCASVTILAYTLAGFVDKKEQDEKCWGALTHFQDGEVFISCKANEGYKKEITAGFDTICSGFNILSEKFPEFVKYEVK